MFDQPLRTDRLGLIDVIADDEKEKGLLAFRKFSHDLHKLALPWRECQQDGLNHIMRRRGASIRGV
jgi:hypothetical protein